ncbi:MAG: diadenylate cyclase CdaA [Saprospiraceae bacterium]|nr:diadenylate cyclase CdaA [Saprospiraceae bacterium]
MTALLLFEIGFLPVRIWDILDILIVAILMYQIYKLLRGNIAFNIFVGVLILYVVWWLVNQLNMSLLAAVLDQFIDVGVIIIIIIFQPEVRRFLLFLGNSTLRQRSNLVGRLIDQNLEISEQKEKHIKALKMAMLRMSRRKTGALIVLTKNLSIDGMVNSGVPLDASISDPLIESIFNKESPLHDGAVLIANGRIKVASSVLPVSENPNLPKSAGLRHRAAVGISERVEVAAFIVSEETGYISLAYKGELTRKLKEEDLEKQLKAHYV